MESPSRHVQPASAIFRVTLIAIALFLSTSAIRAQDRFSTNGSGGNNSPGSGSHAKDPGVRGGAPGAGGGLAGMSSDYENFFTAALARFQEVDSVSGSITNETGVGLGPRFNATSCSGCHAYPSVGGSSPAANPQIAMATADGATNKIPSFITSNGPVREARFINNSNGSPDGGVHDLFVITGRSDASGCNIAQPDFESALEQHNVIFRVPTPLFGAGMVESITDTAILTNAANPQKSAFGISGQVNRSGNDGTVTRFGWKAQNKSLNIFAGEAYNVEMGITNELFPNERGYPPTPLPPSCLINPTPEDATNFDSTTSEGALSDVVAFADFMRFLDQPARHARDRIAPPRFRTAAICSSTW